MFNFIIFYIVMPTLFIVLCWYLRKDIFKIVRPKSVKGKQKTTIAWLIIIFLFSSTSLSNILERMGLIKIEPFSNLITIIGLFVILIDGLWLWRMSKTKSVIS